MPFELILRGDPLHQCHLRSHESERSWLTWAINGEFHRKFVINWPCKQKVVTYHMSEQLGKWLIGLGALLLLAGVVLWLFGDRLSWLGHLPGDIRIEKENVAFYFPITTMILVSIVLSLLFTFLSRLLGK